MNSDQFNRVAYPTALAVTGILAFAVPLVCRWRATGRWPVASKAGPIRERWAGILLFLCGILFATWAALYALLGGESLSVFPVPLWLVFVGWCVAATGFGIVLAGQRQMGMSWRIGVDSETTPLVTEGLFGFCRHPIYSGLLVSLAALLAVSPSVYLVALVVITIFLVRIQARIEEQNLARVHDAEFWRWAARVGRFVPVLGRLSRTESDEVA